MLLRLVGSGLVASLVAGTLTCAPAQQWSVAATTTPATLADASAVADGGAAQAIARRFGRPVTVDADTTETDVVEALPDGTFRATQNEQPVRIRRNGGWVAADPALTAVDGALAPAAAAVPVRFSLGGSSQLAEVLAADGTWLSETWPGGALPAPSVSGRTATYRNVYPGVDLQLAATATGMSQVLVVKNPGAARNPALAHLILGIDNGSLTATSQTGGTAAMKDRAGRTQLTTGAATWWDSSTAGTSANGPGGVALPQPLPVSVTDTELTVDAAAVVRRSDLTYPVYLDPSLAGYNVGWTYVDKTFPDQSYWEDTHGADTAQHVGFIDAADTPPTDNQDHTTRSFWQMDTSKWPGTNIVSSAFNVTNVYSLSCSPRTVDLYTAGAATSATTWNNQPVHTTPAVDSQTFAYGYSSSCPATTNDASFDATAAVQRAATAKADVINFELVADNEGDRYGWKKFGGQAELVTVYQTIPQVGTITMTGHCWAVCGSNPVLHTDLPTYTVTPSQADDTNVQLDWQVCAGTTSSQGGCETDFKTLTTSANQAASQVEPPDERVPTGPWVVRVTPCRADATAICGATSDWMPFRTDLIAPGQPGVTSADLALDNLSVTQGVAYTRYPLKFSAPSGETNMWGYAYSLNNSAFVLSTPTCPRTSGDVSIICTSSAPTGYITPLPGTNTVAVWAIDQAGNVTGNAHAYTFQVATPTGATHKWIGHTSDWTNNSTTVADAVGVGTQRFDLTLSNTTWITNGFNETDGSALTDPNADPNLAQNHNVASVFNGTSSQATTAAGSLTNPVLALDANTGITVAAWVRANPADGQSHVVLSQDDGSNSSRFTLGEDGTGHWQFCLPQTAAVNTAQDCATSAGLAQTGGDWDLVVGAWEPTSKQIVLDVYRYRDGGWRAAQSDPAGEPQDESTTFGSHIESRQLSPGPVVVGRGRTSTGAAGNWWSGAIADPQAYNYFMDPVARADLASSGQ